MVTKSEKYVKALFMSAVFTVVYLLLQAAVAYFLGLADAYSAGVKITSEEFYSRYVMGNIFFAPLGAMLLAGGVYIVIALLREQKPHISFKPACARQAYAALLLAAGLRCLVSIYCVYAERVPRLVRSAQKFSSLSDSLDSGFKIIAALFVSVIAAPVFEEILFRALVTGELLKAFSPPAAIFLGAVVFCLAHGSLYQAVFTFFVGLALGYCFYKTKSLFTSITVHIIFNATSLTRPFFADFNAYLNLFLALAAAAAAVLCLKIIGKTES